MATWVGLFSGWPLMGGAASPSAPMVRSTFPSGDIFLTVWSPLSVQ